MSCSNSLRSDFAFARYNTDGTLDKNTDADPSTPFDTDGKLTTPIGGGDDEIKAVAIHLNGPSTNPLKDKIIVAGYAFGVGGNMNKDFALTRYDTAGNLDTGFAADGKVTTAIGSGLDEINALAIQTDDKIVVGGISSNGTNLDFALARYNGNDGSLDADFGNGGKVITPIGSVDDALYALAIQSDGKIVAAGDSFNGTHTDFALVRYNSDGSLDTTFDNMDSVRDGKVTTPIGSGSSSGRAIAIQPDGKILVAGFASNGSDFDFALARYATDGKPDTSFGTNGMVITPVGTGHDIVHAMGLQSDGKIVVAGGSITGQPIGVFALVRFLKDGSLDTGFGNGGKVSSVIGAEGNTDSQALALAFHPDGKIVAGGFVFNPENKRDFALARFLSDGSLDQGFGVGGKEVSPLSAGIDEIHGLAIQADGKILAAGVAFNDSDVNADFHLTRYNP